MLIRRDLDRGEKKGGRDRSLFGDASWEFYKMDMQSIHQKKIQQPEETHTRASSESRVPASTPRGEEATRRQTAAGLVISGPASGYALHAFTLPA